MSGSSDESQSSELVSLIASLQLERHPEGGWFKRWHTSPVEILGADLSRAGRGYSADAVRPTCTAIHYLLAAGGTCKLHIIKGDELWAWQGGSHLVVVELVREAGVLAVRRTTLGPDARAGQVLVHSVPGGRLFGAYTPARSPFCLVSCIVSPGFHFLDWRMPSAAALREEEVQGGCVIGEEAEAAIAWLAVGGEQAGRKEAPTGWE